MATPEPQVEAVRPDLIGLPPSVEVAAAEAAAAGVEVGALEFFPVLVVLGMIAAASVWLRPQFEAQTQHHHSILFRAVTWPARRLLQAVHAIEHRVLHKMSGWLAPKVRILTHFFNSVTALQHATTQALGDLADNTHEALTFLRHHVIPQMIQTALKPVRARLAQAEDAIDSLNTRIHTAAVEISDQLEGIGKTVGQTFTAAIGQLAVALVELWHFVHTTIVNRLDHIVTVLLPALEARIEVVEHAVTETLPQELTAIRDRLKGIEDYIVSAAFIAVIVAAVEKALGFLTCRNMKQFGNEACAAEDAVMDTLTALAFGAFIFGNLRELTYFAQAVEGEITGLVKDALDA